MNHSRIIPHISTAVFKASRVFGFFMIALTLSCSHSAPRNANINIALLQKDFRVLRQTLEEAHPGLYWYTDKYLMDHYFDSVGGLLDHDMSKTDFFKFLLPVIANVRCSHTAISLPANDTGNNFEFTGLLPFNFFCSNGRLFIKDDFRETGHSGAEVISINGNPAGKIIETLLNRLPADGFIKTYKYYLLNLGAFREGYAAFFGNGDDFNMEILHPVTKKLLGFSVSAMKPKELPLKARTSPPFLALQFPDNNNTAILCINSFEIGTERFRDTIYRIFNTIHEKNSQQLIIDIRENGGGNNDNVGELFTYITTDTFHHLKSAEMNRGTLTYRRYFSQPHILENLHGIPEEGGKYSVNYLYRGTTLRKPALNGAFKGKIILLISGHTSSAASEFAALVRSHKRALIIGEETGGCYYGGTGGRYISLELPASGFVVRIPAIRIFNDVTEDQIKQPKGRGTFPDLPVIPDIEAILSGRDVQMDTALDLIRKNGK